MLYCGSHGAYVKTPQEEYFEKFYCGGLGCWHCQGVIKRHWVKKVMRRGWGNAEEFPLSEKDLSPSTAIKLLDKE